MKAEDGSIRTYATQMDHRGAPGDHGAARRPMHRATSSREIRPMTDLQIHPAQTAMMGGRPPVQHQRWPAVVYPPGIDPSLTTQRTMGHRRFSSSGSAQSMTSVTPPGYMTVPAGYNPALVAGRMPAGIGRHSMSSYPNPPMHPTASPPQYHQPYGVPFSPYPEHTGIGNRMSMGEGPGQRDPREGLLESAVRLPPIYPSPVANPQPPRPSEPYTAAWSPSHQQTQDFRQHQTGFMEPISPSNQMRPPVTDVGQMSHLSALSPTEAQSQRLPPPRTYDEQREHEGGDGDSSRPAKRRKMALDDMVND